MQEAKHPTTTTTNPPLPSPSLSSLVPSPYHQYHYGTFSPSQPPLVVGAAYHASPTGFGCNDVVAIPYTVQQQVFVEGVPVREPPLPFCGLGLGWFLFLLGFFLAAIPWAYLH